MLGASPADVRTGDRPRSLTSRRSKGEGVRCGVQRAFPADVRTGDRPRRVLFGKIGRRLVN